MGECEFRKICGIVWGVVECPPDSKWWKECRSGQQKLLEQGVFNSPQFQERFVDRNSLLKAIGDKSIELYIILHPVFLELIRTHGLKEEE